MTRRRRWSFWMPPLDHPPILWLDDHYRGWLTENGRVVFWGAVISFISLIASGSFLIAIALGFSVAVLILSALFGFVGRPSFLVQVQRDEMPDVVEGSIVHYRVSLANTGKTTLHQLIVEERGLVPELRPMKEPSRIQKLRPGETKSVLLALRCIRRGAYTLDRLQVSTALPTGFVKIGKSRRYKKLLVVHPRPIEVGLGRIFSENPREDLPRNLNSAAQKSNELISLRKWESGDQIRDVHWRATARRGHLVAKEYAPQSKQSVVMFLDLEAKSAKDEQKLDQLISLAAALAKYTFSHQVFLSVCHNTHAPEQNGGKKKQANLRTILDDLAGLESTRKVDFHLAEQMICERWNTDLVILLLAKLDSRRNEFVSKLRNRGCRLMIHVDPTFELPKTWVHDEKIEVLQ